MTTLHHALCKEIESHRIDDETPYRGSGRISRGTSSWLHYQSRTQSRRRHTYSASKYRDAIPVSHSYILLEKDPSKTTRKGNAKSLTLSLDLERSPRDFFDGGHSKVETKVLMTGWLHKTTRLKSSKTRGHRQHRKFKLTAHSLEYSNLLQKVKVQKQFPLTSIINITYDEYHSPVEFMLEFQNSVMTLEAHDQVSCKQWVDRIRKAWKRWSLASTQIAEVDKDVISIEDLTEEETKPEDKEYLEKNKARRNLDCITTGLVTNPNVAEKCFATEIPRIETKTPLVHQLTVPSDYATQPAHSSLQKFQARIGLAPRVQRSFDQWKSFTNIVGDTKDFALLSKCNFVMIKYPRKGRSIPHERVFKMDYENLLIMWHQTEDSKFTFSRTLMTEHIVDVREGQSSDGFDRYPYEEMEEQSLSILFEGEKQTVPGGKYYAVLQSLDLIFDSCEEQQLWYNVLKQFISPKCHLYSSRYQFTDPTIMWLVTRWSILMDKGEIKEDTALQLGYSLVPYIKRDKMEQLLTRAHQCQLKESEHHGHSLHWDGFICFFNLLCEIDESNCLLLKVFENYAKTYPTLGMTVEEFQNFLIKCQHWSPEDATNEKCVELIVRYDYHYRAYKMYKARSTPFEFYMSLALLSFGGFLSFLKSPDNSVIDKLHEEIYQDMDQPLSHYFINSSHNTYLEGHQLTGRSTTDAYVRALLQGCRCLELDCWDGPNGEPKITHGRTVVSYLPLREVVETIDKYAFNVSIYPLILSLENHCSPDQQAKMAEIFIEIFGKKVEKEENLVKFNGQDRLPSPCQLQGKIILKGTERSAKPPKRSAFTVLKKTIKSPKIMKRKQRKDSQISITEDTFHFPTIYDPMINQEEHYSKNKGDDDDDDDDDDGSQQETGDDEDEDAEENDLSEKLSNLIVYCRSKRIRPWSWDEQKETSVCNMFSFNESAALDRCKDTSEILACTERQFVRTYPAGTRIDSSNYDPIPLWNHGIQMVALNVQTPENFLFLNQGKFRQNGGCGYILKPEVMRSPTGTGYNPNTDEPLKEVMPMNLEITPLSGQHLMVPSKKIVSMEIHYETYGIPHDCEKKKATVCTHETNPLWPQFYNISSLEKTIYMPELCLVLFAVYIRVSRKLQAGTKQMLLGQNVFPLESLKPGLRFIPLRTPGGQSVSHIGIFVEIKMRQLNPKQASSSGMCSLQDLKSPMKRFSSPKILETYKLSSVDETVEDVVTLEEQKSHSKKEKIATTCLLHNAAADGNSDTKSSCKQGKIVCQEAVKQCTVEIHANPFTDDLI